MFKQPVKNRVYFLVFVLMWVMNSAISRPASGPSENLRCIAADKIPLATGQSKFLGCAYSTLQATNFTNYWNQVTPENAGKWGSVEGGRDAMNWTALDEAYNLAKDNSFPFRLHVLIWGNQQPGWIESLPAGEQLQEIEEWFAAVAERYPDIDYVEVVNEPLHDPPDGPGNGNYIDALGGSNDLYGTGWDWVIKAFELAREYFPASTKLMINEFGIVDNSGNAEDYVQIINLLKERELIDGIGVQGHAFNTRTGAATMTANLDILAGTGLPIQICEMDVDGPDDETQLDDYKRIFPAFWEHPSVVGITLWGWRHGLWREAQDAYLINDRGGDRPALQWMRTYIISPKAPKLVSPADYATDVPRNPDLVWQASDSATSYSVQLSTNSIFTTILLDSAVTDTTMQLYPLDANKRYYWHVNAMNDIGTSEYSAFARFTTGESTSIDMKELANKPAGFQLFQNYPNPFNSETRIAYSIPYRSTISLKVYNMLGQQVAVLFEGVKNAGRYMAAFDAKDLESGIYFYVLNAGDYVDMYKFTLLK